MSGRFPIPSYPYGWFMADYSDELGTDDVKPLRYFGQDLVAWRDGDGVAHVWDAYCPHLGAHLGVGGHVDGCQLVCPFHGWAFDVEGANSDIPYSERVNKKARLRTYPTVERNGMLLFWWHPDPEHQPEWEVPDVPEYASAEFTDYEKREWTIRTVWQEMAENGVDLAHFGFVHGTPIVPELEEFVADGPYRSTKTIQKFQTPRGISEGNINSEGFGPGVGVVRFTGIVETCMVSSTVPVDDEHVHTRFAFMVRKMPGDKHVNVGHHLIADIEKQMREDIPIWEHKAHLPSPALADRDGPIMPFRRWAAQFYAEPVEAMA